MEWTRSETLALASHDCTRCHGLGMRDLPSNKVKPCDCVFRAIFRTCFRRFIECANKEKYLSRVTFEIHSGRNRRGTWGRKDEEYIADFCGVSERALDKSEYPIFRYHFLLGADWRLCSRKLGIDRGNFFHAVYRIERKLGRTFRELEPYALFPLDEYFSSIAGSPATRSEPRPLRPVVPIRPPMAESPLTKLERKIA